MKIDQSTKGIAESLEVLAELGKNLDQAVVEALEAGGDTLLQGMDRRVPRKTGNLAEHLKRTPAEQDGNYTFIDVGIIHDIAYTDTETARYGTAQEYGTSSMAAQPFIRPTLDEDKGAARMAIIEKLKERMGE